MRPAHLHFLVYKPGFQTIATQVYDPEGPHLETDSQFGVTRALVGRYEKRTDGPCPLEFTFVLEPGQTWMPKAPIAGKAGAA
jgi:catechol 1,2-dioxygenase